MQGVMTETAYLFQCRNDAGLFAVSTHENADNIPPGTAWYAGWRLCGAFALGDPAVAVLNPGRIATRVSSVGYYIWRDGLCPEPGR
jgi:hypothetical protein